MKAWGLATGTYAATAAAAAGEQPKQTEINFTKDLNSAYMKIATNEYYNLLNQGKIDVPAIVFLFFPNLSKNISSGDTASVTEEIVKSDILAIESKLSKIKRIRSNYNSFVDYFDIVFYNPLTNTSSQARRIAEDELKTINDIFILPQTEAAIPALVDDLKLHYVQSVGQQIVNVKKILNITSQPNKVAITALLDKFVNRSLN
jgi:hypothetical protein